MISLPARTHIALGLAGIVTTGLLLAVFIGLLPDRAGAVRQGRIALAESIAATSTTLITANERRRLESALRFLVERNAELLSAAVRDARGELVAAAGEHSAWEPLESGSANDSQIQVPLWSGQRRWGQLELRFQPIVAPGLGGVLEFPGLILGAVPVSRVPRRVRPVPRARAAPSRSVARHSRPRARGARHADRGPAGARPQSARRAGQPVVRAAPRQACRRRSPARMHAASAGSPCSPRRPRPQRCHGGQRWKKDACSATR